MGIRVYTHHSRRSKTTANSPSSWWVFRDSAGGRFTTLSLILLFFPSSIFYSHSFPASPPYIDLSFLTRNLPFLTILHSVTHRHNLKLSWCLQKRIPEFLSITHYGSLLQWFVLAATNMCLFIIYLQQIKTLTHLLRPCLYLPSHVHPLPPLPPPPRPSSTLPSRGSVQVVFPLCVQRVWEEKPSVCYREWLRHSPFGGKFTFI